MNPTRSITISLVLALAAVAPTSALARNGADDDPSLGDGRGGQQVAPTTKAPSGSFSLERRLRNGAGRDTISAEATSPSGEVCSATLTI